MLCKKGLACNFLKKESLAQVFSCEFCEISKNTFFYKTPPLAASKDFLSFYSALTYYLFWDSFICTDEIVVKACSISNRCSWCFGCFKKISKQSNFTALSIYGILLGYLLEYKIFFLDVKLSVLKMNILTYCYSLIC